MTQTTITATQAQKYFNSYLKEVAARKKTFIIKRDGKPMAALISIDDLEDTLEVQNPRIKKEIEATEKDLKGGKYITLHKL